MRDLISAKETARILGCSERHIYDLISRGKLISFKNGITRIYKTSLEDYLRKHSGATKTKI